MIMYEREIYIPRTKELSLLNFFAEIIKGNLEENEIPIRFVITKTDKDGFYCELGILKNEKLTNVQSQPDIFHFKNRTHQRTDQFNAVLIIPTGIDAEIGGHSGDGSPTARLLASMCDTLITHPNVVNASDINEIPENALYVEGSVLTRLIMGTIGLQKIRSNRVILVIDEHEDERFQKAAINLASAARASFGIDCPFVLTIKNNVQMESVYSKSGRAVGKINNFESLYHALLKYSQEYDAIALSSIIRMPPAYHTDYYLGGMVNPWGGVEAMLTHALSLMLNIPSAHSPMLESMDILNMDIGVVDPRMAAEIVSVTFLFSVIKGLHRSPKIITTPEAFFSPGIITAADIDCIVIPDGVVGLPILAAIEQEIPVIAVRENKNNMKNNLSEYPFKPGQLIYAENYWEAAGIMAAMKAGVKPDSVRRPFSFTRVERETEGYYQAADLQKEKIADLTRYFGKKDKLA